VSTIVTAAAWWAAGVLDRADARRWSSELALRWEARQAGAVAELSVHALSGADPGLLREEAVRLLTDALRAGAVEYVEADAGGRRLPVPDPSTSGTDSQGGWIQERSGTCGAFVPVGGAARRWGVLAAYAEAPRCFTDGDLRLLHAVAGVLGKASDRAAADQALRLSEQKFAGLFRSSPDAVAVLGVPDGRLQEVNDGFVELTGFSAEECAGVELGRLGPWHDAPVLLRTIDERTAVRNLETPLVTRSGETRVVLCSTEPVALGGKPSLLLVMRDISDRKRVQSAIQEANDRLSRWVNELEDRGREISLLSEMGDLLQSCATPDEAGRITVKVAQQLLPGSSGALCLFSRGGGLLEAVASWGGLGGEESVFAPQECWALRRGRPHAVSDPESGLLCAHVRHPQARTYLCVPMVAQSEAIGVLHVRRPDEAYPGDTSAAWLSEPKQRLVVAMADHTALALANLRLRDTLRSQSVRDPLTGLHNRRYLEETLERELLRARRAEWPVGVLMLDLDKFKAINDTFGHDAGDEVLKAVAHVLQTRLRGTDLVCRYGGEEFVIVLPQTALPGTLERGDDIRRLVRGLTLSHRTRALGRVSVSVGAASFPEHGDTMGELLKAADAALYRVKAKGGDVVEAASAMEGMPSLPFTNVRPGDHDRRS
jgi:diguanylate cyclase (GGDEF)-like protein/PAS domain S-box-containing protein